MKFKFIKLKDETNHFDTTNVTVESDAIGLPELLEDIASFLKACGFVFDELEVVHEDELN